MASDPKTSDRLFGLVADALALPVDEREAFLAAACTGDEDLRGEIQSLLAQAGEAETFLEQPVFKVDRASLAASAKGELPPGTRLGDCEVLGLLGQGGMGEVYLARDLKLERQVAVKVLRRSLDEDTLQRRFRHERRVLAGLTHSNIARLYGGGTTAEGRSYLVMEYVEGERLDRYCDLRGLDIPARVALFCKVCAAVSYAHQNLVVHRDLKPANVRVTPEGEPKLLDFGIAKLLDPEGAGAHVDPTMTLSGAMTPEYASPEQLKGEAITTVSDVYSLGVILYELLCGQRPYASLKSRRPDELVRAICEQEPPRPSTVVNHAPATTITATVPPGQAPVSRERPATLRRLLAGDLDNIVAKALRTEPARRYPSVLALSEDLRRHAEGLPVSARRDTLGYRTGKFVRRNRALVAAGALVILALLVGLVATTLEARRADRRFEDVRRLAHAILFQVEPQLANLPGTIPVRGTLVHNALEYLDSLAREAGNRRDLRHELAAAYEKVGAVQGEPNQPNLGDFPGALASYRKALALRQTLAAADPWDLQERHKLAICEQQLGEILWWSNQTAAAEESLHAALALRRGLVAEQPRSVEFRRGLASVLIRLGEIPAWTLQTAEAMAFYRQALPILQSLAQEHPQDPEVQLDLARCLADTGSAQKDVGDYPDAAANLAAAESITTVLVQQEPDSYAARNALWFSRYEQVEVLMSQGSTDRALELCPRMVEAAASLAKADPGNATCQNNLSLSHGSYARALVRAQRWPEALTSFQAALAVEAKLVTDSSANVDYQRVCGEYHVQLGRVQMQLGELALAEGEAQAGQDSLESVNRLNPGDNATFQDLVQAYTFRGDLCEQRSEGAQARQWFERALETLRSRPDAEIAAADLKEWNDLREKLAAKTALAVAPTPSP